MRQLYQENRLTNHYIDNYLSMMNRCPIPDLELLYQVVIVGLSPRETQSATGWVGERVPGNERLDLAEINLRISKIASLPQLQLRKTEKGLETAWILILWLLELCISATHLQRYSRAVREFC